MQGGDGYGVVQVFVVVGWFMLIIIMGNCQDELKWWGEQCDVNQYEIMFILIVLGVLMLVFWVVQQILDGQDVFKDLIVFFLLVMQDMLDQVFELIFEGGVINVDYMLDDVK